MFNDIRNPSHAAKRRLIVFYAISNTTIAFIAIVLSLQPGISVTLVIILTLVLAVLVNGAMWIGTRSLHPGPKNWPPRHIVCFSVAALAAGKAALDLAVRNYSSARLSISTIITLLLIGILLMKAGAEKQ